MQNEITKIFGSAVFNDHAMQQRLPKHTYESLKMTARMGLKLDPELAEEVAQAMMDWAVEHGATHFSHWFQPMNNLSAGKHDSFISPISGDKVIMEFSGKELVQGEPDASSFPSGGLRATFEARGYTIWDCTSPAFIRDGTLYIPTAFCSYTGEALDNKTPLLRSMEVLSTECIRLLRLLGNKTSMRVDATVGAEQEYFLIDREKYEQRLDLKICGRTLMGAKPPKGQELDDHYCGRIRLRVSEFMRQLDEELWKVGVIAKTEHNEVAPAQHELAPLYTTANIACDHNQLIMETMRIVAKKNGLACLLHEKPFAGVNGSGKHNNWGISTDDGINLLTPPKTPEDEIQFFLFLSAVVTVVDEYSDLLRLAASGASNDLRLGGNEAPPAIISMFLGNELTENFRHIARGESADSLKRAAMKMGIRTLPELRKDESDRNRTSPFAFTGNRFEFRMVGSSAPIAISNFVMNTAVADVLRTFSDRLEQAEDVQAEAHAIIGDTYVAHGKIIFNGNNYTKEWEEEAKRRGLPNLTNTVDAVASYIAPKNIALFSRNHILGETECHARYEILLENYIKAICIEASTMLEMVKRQVLPACIECAGTLAYSYNQMKQAGIENRSIKLLMQEMSELVESISAQEHSLEAELLHSGEIADTMEEAVYLRDVVRAHMEALRASCDQAEKIMSSEHWPMPNYTDLLHRV